MHAPTDNTAPSRSEQAADPTHPPSNLVGIWARGRRRFTPWAFPRLRALAAVRFAAGLFLAGLGALMLSRLPRVGGSSAAGGLGGAFLNCVPGLHRRPLRTSPHLCPRRSHRPDGGQPTWRAKVYRCISLPYEKRPIPHSEPSSGLSQLGGTPTPTLLSHRDAPGTPESSGRLRRTAHPCCPAPVMTAPQSPTS